MLTRLSPFVLVAFSAPIMILAQSVPTSQVLAGVFAAAGWVRFWRRRWAAPAVLAAVMAFGGRAPAQTFYIVNRTATSAARSVGPLTR
jgi:hypothetical protein